MADRHSLSLHYRELLLSLAYLGGLTLDLAERLLPCYTRRTLQRDLNDLRHQGLTTRQPVHAVRGGRAVKLYDVWSLTEAGQADIARQEPDRVPIRLTRRRAAAVLPHDLLVVETIVSLVEQARREHLSGLYVQFEMRLHPSERRPIPDAVVLMQLGGAYPRPDLVPWSRDPAVASEACSRFVIEVDNHTEPLSTIAGKARAYRDVFDSAAWCDQWEAKYGPCPLLLWVVADRGNPTKAGERLSSIFDVVHAEWRTGYWLGVTEQSLQRRMWAIHSETGQDWHPIVTLRQEVTP